MTVLEILQNHMRAVGYKDVWFENDPVVTEKPGDPNGEYVDLSVPTFQKSVTRIRVDDMSYGTCRIVINDRRYLKKEMKLYVDDENLDDAKKIVAALADPDTMLGLVGVEAALEILESYLKVQK